MEILKMENTITEIKNSVGEFYSIDRERISELEDRSEEYLDQNMEGQNAGKYGLFQ